MLSASPNRRPLSAWARILAPLVLGLAVLASWTLVSLNPAVSALLVPAPASVWQKLVELSASGQLASATTLTLWEALLGCLLASLIAIPLGFLIANFRLFEAATSPYLASSQAVPAVAIAPLLVIWAGYGTLPIVLLCSLLVFFPVTLTTIFGVRSLDVDLLNAARVDGACGWAMLRFIAWPLALPAILTGLRNGFTLSITGAVIGELVMGGQGLGMLLSVQSSRGDIAGLFATLATLCLLAVGLYLGLLAIERTIQQN